MTEERLAEFERWAAEGGLNGLAPVSWVAELAAEVRRLRRRVQVHVPDTGGLPLLCWVARECIRKHGRGRSFSSTVAIIAAAHGLDAVALEQEIHRQEQAIKELEDG